MLYTVNNRHMNKHIPEKIIQLSLQFIRVILKRFFRNLDNNLPSWKTEIKIACHFLSDCKFCSFWQIFNPILPIFIGQIFIVAYGQILKNNFAIWSFWLWRQRDLRDAKQKKEEGEKFDNIFHCSGNFICLGFRIYCLIIKVVEEIFCEYSLTQIHSGKMRNDRKPILAAFIVFFKKWAKPGLIFVYFCSFHMTNLVQINDKSVDGVLGTRTRDSRMVGADKSTELWRHPFLVFTVSFYFSPTCNCLLHGLELWSSG